MPKKIDLTGKRFGKLLVQNEADRIITPNGRSHIAWNCICDCGNLIVARGDLLRNGHILSCGCHKKEILRQSGINRKNDLTNKIFGDITVLGDDGTRGSSGDVMWLCQCKCGNIIHIATGNLTRKKGGTISCGCRKSRGEQKIAQCLMEMQILFLSQKRFDSCISPKTGKQLIFDFFLPEYNLCIEYDGIQHFEEVKGDFFNLSDTKERDMYKENWCRENNINLVRIPYTDFDKINTEYMEALVQRYF